MGKTAYGEFTFNKPKERMSIPGYAHGGKVDAPTPMKKGGKTKAKTASKKMMKKEVEMLREVEMPETMPMSPLASAARPPMAPPGMMKKGGKVHEDAKMDKAAMKKAVHKHESHMHPGKPMTKLKKGGVPTFNRSPKVC
jgi:hypothetical protein